MWKVRASLVAAAFLLGAAATLVCLDASRAAPGSRDALHEVQPGDNLHLIAGYYYGDARQWDRIWETNRDRISNPNRIEPGMLLRIPDTVVPEEPYADFAARARGAMGATNIPARAEAPAEVPPIPQVAGSTPGETPPPPAIPQEAPIPPPGPGAPEAEGPPPPPGAPTEAPPRQP